MTSVSQILTFNNGMRQDWGGGARASPRPPYEGKPGGHQACVHPGHLTCFELSLINAKIIYQHVAHSISARANKVG